MTFPHVNSCFIPQNNGPCVCVSVDSVVVASRVEDVMFWETPVPMMVSASEISFSFLLLNKQI